MFQHLEAGDHVIGRGVARRMRLDRLGQDRRAAGARQGVQVEALVGRLRHQRGEGAVAAADIEHPVARPDMRGRGAEIAALRGMRRELLHGAVAPVEGAVEGRVAGDGRVEEAQPAGRPVQAERARAAMQRRRRHPGAEAPEIGQQLGRDRLEPLRRRLPGDRARAATARLSCGSCH